MAILAAAVLLPNCRGFSRAIRRKDTKIAKFAIDFAIYL